MITVKQLNMRSFVFRLLLCGAWIVLFSGYSSADTEWLHEPSFRLKVVIPSGWRKTVKKKELSMRVELRRGKTAVIAAEFYKGFNHSLFNYRDIIWRRQKRKFRSLEKIASRSIEQNNVAEFLQISRFRVGKKLYLQRTYGKKTGKYAYIVNYSAVIHVYYRYSRIFDHFAANIHYGYIENPSESETPPPPPPPEEPPVTSVNPDDVQLDYVYLKNDRWGYCTRENIRDNSGNYYKDELADGGVVYCPVDLTLEFSYLKEQKWALCTKENVIDAVGRFKTKELWDGSEAKCLE